MKLCGLGHFHATPDGAAACDARQASAVDEIDPTVRHAYVAPQLARAKFCAACGKPSTAPIHLIGANRGP